MQIGIIGAGKVGCSMGKYMKEHGLPVAGYFSRSVRSSEEAGTFTGTKMFKDLKSIVAACDILCISTPDDVIGRVWSEIRELSQEFPEACTLKNKVLCHFSGSLSSVVFSEISSTGASGCSVHPMSAFSDKFTSYQQLNQVVFTMEGQAEALRVMGELLTVLGNQVLQIRPENKVLYHCSASLVSNFMIGLYQMGLDILGQCGINEEDARGLFGPLVENNVKDMIERGTAAALTGPIERGDAGTVKKHLEALCEEDGELYRRLGRKVLKVAERKNPDRDYENIKQILRQGCRAHIQQMEVIE